MVPVTTDGLQQIEGIYQSESRRVLATLIRLLGDFDLAEEALHDAWLAAMEQWPGQGVPAQPRAWLVSTGRFKAIDSLRRRARFKPLLAEEADHLQDDLPDNFGLDEVEDDRLRLIFTCCHPALTPDAQVALTLREVCGLATEEIAHAFLTPAPTLAQRIVRAKAKIRDAKIPFQVPSSRELPGRLPSVLRVIYLIFNEGYSASIGDAVTRRDLTGEAIRLGRLLADLLPEPEVLGLLALMLLQDSRGMARMDDAGNLLLLERQDRSLWNRHQIAEGLALVEKALASQRFGPYALQAAIAAVHAESPDCATTDWEQIAALYAILGRLEPSPVVELNQAVAIAMRDGPLVGLARIDRILARGDLSRYHLLHAARADLLRRSGQLREARAAYARALALVQQGAEHRFLEHRLRELESIDPGAAPQGESS